jgi:hypothetical protein
MSGMAWISRADRVSKTATQSGSDLHLSRFAVKIHHPSIHPSLALDQDAFCDERAEATGCRTDADWFALGREAADEIIHRKFIVSLFIG